MFYCTARSPRTPIGSGTVYGTSKHRQAVLSLHDHTGHKAFLMLGHASRGADKQQWRLASVAATPTGSAVEVGSPGAGRGRGKGQGQVRGHGHGHGRGRGRGDSGKGQGAAAAEAQFKYGESDAFFQAVLTNEDIAKDPEGHKSGYVAFVGRPNAGKSTLLNALLGQKLSIVSYKAQTTRHRVAGILSDDTYQMILVDTPGFIVNMRNKLEEMMMTSVKRALKDADAVMVLIDVTVDHKEQLACLAPPPDGPPTAILLNKIDTVPEEDRTAMIKWFQEATSAAAVLPISALHGTGLEGLKEWAIDAMPEGPTLYPKEQLSEHPERFFVSEILREKLFLQYEQEVPYACQVNVVEFKERKKGKDLISVHVVVEREAHRGILLGKGGAALKQLATAARMDIEEFLQRSVYLDISVKVVEGWRKDSNILKQFGYA